MATWNDLEGVTWQQINGMTWGQLERLSSNQIESYINDVWPVLFSLDARERAALVEGFLDGSLPPALVADSESRYSKIQQVALALWTTYKPSDASSMAAYLAVLVALASIIHSHYHDEPPAQAPPEIHIIIENHLPDSVKPNETGGGEGRAR
jgi:hypothetical protein